MSNDGMISTVEVIGMYQGYPYRVIKNRTDLMEWYSGYVRLPKGHPYVPLCSKKSWIDLGLQIWKLEKKTKKKPKEHRRYFYNGYEDMKIQVHGGLTFSRYFKERTEHFSSGAWVGWDYAHYDDDFWIASEKDVSIALLPLYKQIKEIERTMPIAKIRRTSDDVIKDCIKVIDQLRAIEGR